MTTDATPACLGKTQMDDHPMVEIGKCSHRVGGSIHGYLAFGCPDCGVTGHRGPISFACGPRIKAEPLTTENCAALRCKAEREGKSS